MFAQRGGPSGGGDAGGWGDTPQQKLLRLQAASAVAQLPSTLSEQANEVPLSISGGLWSRCSSSTNPCFWIWHQIVVLVPVRNILEHLQADEVNDDVSHWLRLLDAVSLASNSCN